MGDGNAPASAGSGGRTTFDFRVVDLVYSNAGGKPRLARLYQPAGAGGFPAVVQIHGGAWNNKDRTDGQNTALDLAAAGTVVLSIDFRNAPEAPYPASLSDINYGIRWLKAHAAEFGTSAAQVGAFGTSSGGHQALLAAIRPDDPRYRAQPLPEAPDMDARLAFVISGWGVLYPLDRLAARQGAGQGRPDQEPRDVLWHRRGAHRGDADADHRARRKSIPAACARLPGRQGRMDDGRAGRAAGQGLARRRRHVRGAIRGRRAPHLCQRASLRAQFGEYDGEGQGLHRPSRGGFSRK